MRSRWGCGRPGRLSGRLLRFPLASERTAAQHIEQARKIGTQARNLAHKRGYAEYDETGGEQDEAVPRAEPRQHLRRKKPQNPDGRTESDQCQGDHEKKNAHGHTCPFS